MDLFTMVGLLKVPDTCNYESDLLAENFSVSCVRVCYAYSDM